MELKSIPGILGYFAGTDGCVYDQHGIKKTSYFQHGYLRTLVPLLSNIKETLGLHNLIALAFHGHPSGDQDRVNHRDRNRSNNRPDNLEWVSPLQNNVHAKVMKKNNHRFCIVGVFTNVDGTKRTEGFMSVWDVEEKLDIPHLSAWDSIKNNQPVNGWIFSFKKYSGNIPKDLQKERIKTRKEIDGKVPTRGVKFRNIDTGEVLSFDSFIAAGKHFDTYPSHIHQAIPYRDVVRIFKKQYQVAYLDQQFQYLSSDDIEKALAHGKKNVVAWQCVEKKIYFFESASQFIEQSKLARVMVYNVLKSSSHRRIGNWVIRYLTNESVTKLLEHVKGSSPDMI
jgi:hypothetical protein